MTGAGPFASAAHTARVEMAHFICTPVMPSAFTLAWPQGYS
jgi:hypothetical protein